MRPGLIAIAAVTFASLGVGAAGAQAPPTVEQLLEPAAFAHYAAGKAHYDVGDHGAAIASFRAAYQLHPHPVLVFAIAKAQQKNRDCAGSIESLRRFVREGPGPAWVARASQEIARCEAELAWQAAVEQARGRAARRRRWSYAIAATGAVSLAGAAVAAGRRGHHLGLARGAETSGAYLEHLGRADRWTTAAVALGAAGGVAIGGGLALWLTAEAPPAAPAELRPARIEGIALVPSSSGLGVVVGGRFR